MNAPIRIIGRIALYGFAIIGIAVVLLIGTAIVKQHAKDRQFVREELLPLAAYIEQFRARSGHLPSAEEFEAWSRNTYPNKGTFYYSHKPDFCRSWGENDKDFLVGAWRGEWIHYYCSWNGRDFADDEK